MRQFKDYEEFDKHMMESYPQMFSRPFGGFEVGPGWWPILDILCNVIQGRIDNNHRQIDLLTESNPHNITIPKKIPQVIVSQIKEKFAGLRFYYDGGDDKVEGLVIMAEIWCGNTCEDCGLPGKTRTGGWMRTLCDQHAKEQNYGIR